MTRYERRGVSFWGLRALDAFFAGFLRVGFKSLLLHKLRSALAILGILVGVTAVIWLVAMGEGVSYQAQQQIKDLGANNIIIRSVKPPQDSSKTRSTGPVVQYGLLRDDFERIRLNVPTIEQMVPMRELRKESSFQAQSADTRIVGCTPEYFALNHLELDSGRLLRDADLDQVDNVCVIGHATAERIFEHLDPIGNALRVDRDLYVVVGVTAEKTPSAAIGGSFAAQDYNMDVYVPMSTFRSRFSDTVSTARPGSFGGEDVQLSQITASVKNLDLVEDTVSLIESLLAPHHPNADYAVVVPKELLRQAEILQMMFNVLLVLIAGIALLVGGIGIMNIMLATVTERTREIGIRRALGAKRRDIVTQFLSETVVLSASGGLLGVVCGFFCGPAVAGVRHLFDAFFPAVVASLPPNIRELEPRIAMWSVGAAFLISVGVGVAFGIYPARRAAMMDPIEALRHE